MTKPAHPRGLLRSVDAPAKQRSIAAHLRASNDAEADLLKASQRYACEWGQKPSAGMV